MRIYNPSKTTSSTIHYTRSPLISVSWNSIVSVYSHCFVPNDAVFLFREMTVGYGILPDTVGVVNILPVSGFLGLGLCGKQVHGLCVFERMRFKDVVTWNAMVTGYSQNGRFEDALSLFGKMREEKIELDVVTWSSVISGYAQRGFGCEAMDVFRKMCGCRCRPNVVKLMSLLSACASVGALLHGKETHCYSVKFILKGEHNDDNDDLAVINALIDMYAKCKSLEVARAMFDEICPKDRDVVTWTVMIGGYAQHGDANHALQLFSEMFKIDNCIVPNDFTISCVLMSCARLSALKFGKQIHAHVLRRSHSNSDVLFVANCLIDMYSKSGDVDTAQVVFDSMSKRNAVSWTSLLTGYGMHGRSEDAFRVFDEMRKEALVLDGITFLVVLYACSHSGMDFGVDPGVEHYACMVDLLGRAGRLGEAMRLINDMPIEPTPVVWIALLSACRIHSNEELAEFAAKKLLELKADNDGTYTLLSNIYANARRWKDVARIGYLMKRTGIKKIPGWSWVKGRKGMETFYVGDRTHLQSQKIYETLADLIKRIKANFSLHDVDDEEKGDQLSEHSEKLALAYAILTLPPGAPIRITKNLRICGDFHSAITYISMIVEHEIILRDSSRFHQFKNGSCSCKGYW
ncbi:putative tetratricopeptide-like helical domain, DYW domain-containing protein [Medicago truncatula]|uniref:Putative tetratricopeptide-like helical domain, DYW domain-containing protein n=1 Tax=Medicago truncatula TaxID=3880 RepID=A0A396JQF4_MEDTR|nr:putative tetratricopeptide-like helical domain, DYW domain-containing protein [Medicago truncatula]